MEIYDIVYFEDNEKNEIVITNLRKLVSVREGFSGLTISILDIDEKVQQYYVFINLGQTRKFHILSTAIHELIHWFNYMITSNWKLQYKFNVILDMISELTKRILGRRLI